VIRSKDILEQSTTHTRSFTYDAAGNVISETDEEENTTYYEYDALNRVARVTESMGGVVERTYDDRGNLIELKDPNNGITFYEYDRNNRLTKVTKPLQQETIYAYDAVGNRITVLDTKGQKISYEYNAINRLVKVEYFNPGDHVNPVKTVDFTYDKLGNVLTHDDGTTSATYTYDDLQRKISETVNYGPFSKSIAYTYYGNGLKKTFTGPDGNTINYTYDGNNRISGISIPGQGQITYNTYQWNSPTRITLPGGNSTDYTYDPLMRLKSILAKDPGQNATMTRNYQHSPVGNITEKDTEHGNYVYQYDDLYRLTAATNRTIADEAYTYDAIGNRLTSAGVGGTWNYNANNELQAYGNVTFQYDLNGNTTNKTNGTSQTNYVYDVEDRLTRVEDGEGSVIAQYYYDPFGRRLCKEVDGVKTYFLYSDEGLIAEYGSTGTELRTYGYAPDSQWSTDPLFQKTGGVYFWYQNDHLGTPQKLIASNGLVVWAAAYDSFGNTQIDIEGIESNLRFPGQYYDEETGLHYNLNRYYDPVVGRYLRTEPFGDGLNLYAHVFANPINWIDPLGLCAAREVWSTTKYLAYESWEYFWYDWFFEFSDFVAGFGDTISLGATRQIRGQWNEAYGWKNSVDYSSGNYEIGKYTGYAWFAGTGVAAVEAGAVGTLGVAARTAWGLSKSAGVIAWTWTTPRLVKAGTYAFNQALRPKASQFASEFLQGYIPSTSPPPTFAGWLGFTTGRLISRIGG